MIFGLTQSEKVALAVVALVCAVALLALASR